MTFDPTTNRTPWALLTDDERKALQEWPHGWECTSPGMCGKWIVTEDPSWASGVIYRGKPAPKRTVAWVTIGQSGSPHAIADLDAVKDLISDNLVTFRIEYNADGSEPEIFVEDLE